MSYSVPSEYFPDSIHDPLDDTIQQMIADIGREQEWSIGQTKEEEEHIQKLNKEEQRQRALWRKRQEARFERKTGISYDRFLRLKEIAEDMF